LRYHIQQRQVLSEKSLPFSFSTLKSNATPEGDNTAIANELMIKHQKAMSLLER